MKNTQPLLKIEPSQTDRLLDVAGWIVLAATWFVAFHGLFTLPSSVATHFNFHGEPDGWGSPLFLLFLPALASIMIPLLTWLNQRPHLFNYPAKITLENARQHYTRATRFIRTLKLSLGLVFLGIELMMRLSADGSVKPNAAWMLPAIVFLVMGPLVMYLYNSSRKR